MSHFTTGQVVTAAELNEMHMLIAEATANGTSITLSVTIPQTHQDLLVLFEGNHDGGGGNVFRTGAITFNSDTATNYRWARVNVDETGAVTGNASTSDNDIAQGAIGNGTFNTATELTVHGYTTTAIHSFHWKHWTNIGGGVNQLDHVSGSGSYIGGVAVTSIQYSSTTDEIASGSTLRVYGLGLI